MLIHQKRYERHILIGADHYYLGPNWEIKKELGDLRQLYPFGYSNRLPPISDEYKMTDSEYRDFIRKPIVYAISQNMWQIQSNLRNSFYGMRASAISIKEELEQMQLDQ